MRRLLLILAGLAIFLGLTAAPAVATSTACVSAANAAYRHSFDGAAGTVTVTAGRPLCGGQSQSVTLASYTTVGTSGQFVYEAATGRLTATSSSLTLKVAVPGCYAQVVAAFGAALPAELTSTVSAGLGSRSSGPQTWYSGGATACAATPTVTYTYACDGTFTATLANGPDANVSAVFLTGGRRIRLAPGRSTAVKVTKGSTLTVRDSSFTTHVASWQSPATGCVATPAQAPAPAVPPTRPATTTPAPSASASATATATPPTTATDPAYDAPAAYPIFPGKTAAAAKTGMGAGSVALIALGLVMVGAGVGAIAYLIRLNRRIA